MSVLGWCAIIQGRPFVWITILTFEETTRLSFINTKPLTGASRLPERNGIRPRARTDDNPPRLPTSQKQPRLQRTTQTLPPYPPPRHHARVAQNDGWITVVAVGGSGGIANSRSPLGSAIPRACLDVRAHLQDTPPRIVSRYHPAAGECEVAGVFGTGDTGTGMETGTGSCPGDGRTCGCCRASPSTIARGRFGYGDSGSPRTRTR